MTSSPIGGEVHGRDRDVALYVQEHRLPLLVRTFIASDRARASREWWMVFDSLHMHNVSGIGHIFDS